MINKGKAPGTGRLGSMVEQGAKHTPKENKEKAGEKWWKETFPEQRVPGALMATIKHIHDNQSALDQESMVLSGLYAGRAPGSSFGVAHHTGLRGVHPALSGRLTYNLIAIVVDALIAKLTKENLSAQFITNGGDYKQQRRAKKLSQFADGINYETHMDEIGPEVLRDALLGPCGIVHTFPDWSTQRVKSERVLAQEMFVDYADGFYGEPRQVFRVKAMDREVVLDAWGDDPKVREAIEKNHDADPLGNGGEYQGLSDIIYVGEAWRLPSGVDEKGETTDDGRHILFISNAVLTPPEERVWKKKRFPFSVFRWKKDTTGWHGIPLGRDLIGSQVEMNHLNIMFQRAFRMMAAFRIAVENGTVPDQHFQDKIGTILHVPRGASLPQFLTPPALNAQYFQHRDAIKAAAFEIARLSQLSAVGQKPAGLDSGEAQRVYHDIESEGFSDAQKRYEAFRLDVTECQIDAVRDIYAASKKGYKLRAPVSSSALPGHRFLRQLDWKAVEMDEDEYVLRGYSISALPSTPAGKTATVTEWMRAGLIDAELGRKLLNFPDLQQAQSLLGAMEDWITMGLDGIAEDGKPMQVDPLMSLAMLRKLTQQEYALGAANGMEEEKLGLLRDVLAKCDLYEAKAAGAANLQAAAAGPGAAPGGGQPLGVGAPPPVSPMLPPANAPGAI